MLLSIAVAAKTRNTQVERVSERWSRRRKMQVENAFAAPLFLLSSFHRRSLRLKENFIKVKSNF